MSLDELSLSTIGPVAVQVPLAGSYTWAPSLPITRTRPSRSTVSVPSSLSAPGAIFPVAVQVPPAGSNTSALRGLPSMSETRTSTFPSSSNVAATGGFEVLPVADQVPVAGSYNSAEVRFCA